MRSKCQILLILSTLLVLSCATSKNTTSETDGKGVEAIDVPPPEFKLGGGDELTVSVYRNSELDSSVKIGLDGKIHMPLIGDVKASGLTVAELKKKIETDLSKYIQKPQVQINLGTIRSSKVHVLGEVESPGSFILETEMTLWEAISTAGGFSDDANTRKVLLIRETDKGVVASVLNMSMRKAKKEKANRNRKLGTGDVVYVAPSKIASVEKFLVRVNNMLTTFVTFERGVALYPSVIDALEDKDSSDIDVVLTP